MIPQNLPDGTQNPQWVRERIGKLGGSHIADILKSGRGGKPSETRASLAKLLAAERLTDTAANYVSPMNPDIRRGLDLEPEALATYEVKYGVMLDPAAWVAHPKIEHAGATPDSFIAREGLVQIKIPREAKFVSLVLAGELPAEYEAQMSWELACCPWAQWNDLGLYCPTMPPGKRLWVKRLERDPERIAYLEEQAASFLDEVETIFTTIAEMEY